MAINIAFSDFSHTGHSCNSMPYGIALVAAYANRVFGSNIRFEIYKDPKEFLSDNESHPPQILCFSNYIWNIELTCEIARRTKLRNPSTVIIFGGPNYPIEISDQIAFLKARPFIDFYVYKDGELAFSDLLAKLIEHKLDIDFVKSLPPTKGTHYIFNGQFCMGDLPPIINDLNEIPSPYIDGLLDKFFDRGLIPLTQTTRGCPYSCTYCQDGDDYANTVKRYSRERIDEELEYIAQQARVPMLMWADLNFGMYKEDLDTCRTVVRLRKMYGWPLSLDVSGKNKKDRILEAARILDGDDLSGGTVTLVAAVQSTDPDVQKHIKRDNVSIEVMIDLAKATSGTGTSSFSEVILCLPGDTKKAHFKSISDLMECGINVIRSHQFIMLPGSEASTRESRKLYGMQTRFRVTPRTVAPYQAFGETFYAPEIDEICVGNKTLSFQDYVDCRVLNLTVEIFYNYGIFSELLFLLRNHGVSVASFIFEIHQNIVSRSNPLSEIYAGFIRETHELFNSREELENFLRQPNVLEKYTTGKLGNNEQMMYRALAIFNHMKDLHQVAYDVARKLLLNQPNEIWLDNYLNELHDFSLMRKSQVLDVNIKFNVTVHYKFDDLLLNGFRSNPQEFFVADGMPLAIEHSPEQTKLIQKNIQIYGLDNYGLGCILGGQTNVNTFYRSVSAGDTRPSENPH